MRERVAQLEAATTGAGDHYRVLFDYAPVGFGLADQAGNLLAFNDAMLAPGGYSRGDIEQLGNVARLYYRPEDRERVLALARQQGFVWRREVQFRRKDGSPYDTLLSLTPVQIDGRPCWHAMVEDVTARNRVEAQRRQLEDQLRQAQKMEAVGRMTAGVAHDFNNVLAVIMANAEMIAAALPATTRELAADVAELRVAAERGAAMTRKLLAFTRRAELDVQPTDLGAVLDGMRGMLRHVVPAHIALEISAAPHSNARVDARAVEQMVLNLVTNARDAVVGGGAVRVAVGPMVVGRDQAPPGPWMPVGSFVALTVADTGVGMDENTRAHALEPYFTTKPTDIGTGLGLPMVYGLAKQQGGYLDLSSEPGEGTTVTLYFPSAVDAAPAPSAEPSPACAPQGRRATILLLEDDEQLRRTTTRALEQIGYRVLSASDGAAGLALFQAQAGDVDLVITDVVMPGMTGPELYEAMKRQDPGVRVLFSSGYGERELQALGLPSGMPLCHKPWTAAELGREVGRILGPDGPRPPGGAPSRSR